MSEISTLTWQKRFGNEPSCEKVLVNIRWPEGFICPRCDSNHASFIITRKKYQCTQCRYQVSITAGTIFHSTNLTLVKWFWAIYFTASGKKCISVTQLSREIGVSWPTAQKMLQKIRSAMSCSDSIYRLQNLIAFHDANFKGQEKKPILETGL